MADTAVAITAGTGTNIDTRTEATNSNHRQVVVIGDPSLNAGVAAVKDVSVAPVTATDPALVTVLRPDSPGIITTGSQASPSASYLSTVAAGDIAAATSDSGNPVKIGGVGKTANPTAVTDGQRANALFDKLGKQVVVGSIRDLKGNQFTTITSSVSETTVITAVASTFLDVYGCIVENTSATASKVTFKDSTAGTTQFEIYVPAGDTRGFMMPEGGAFKQTTVNTNWTATCGTSVASIVITMLYVKNT